MFLVFLALLLGGFIVSFFFPRTIMIEHSRNFPIDNLDSAFGNNLKNHKKEISYLKVISDVRKDFISKTKNFLEINLSKMKVKLYQNGKPIKEVQILTKGDPQEWGGSAVGIYKILSGNKLSYSIVSKVYMPYALHYYGKYWLHGEPYYSGGRKLISSVSGGCIRLKDENAKDIYELSELGMPVLAISKEKDYYQFTNKDLSEFPEISAKSYLVADLDSGFVFAEKNSQEKLPIASLTKLMTAIVVAENVDLRKSVLVKPEMLEAYGSTKGLEVGKSFRVVELFYPLLISSSNDAAEVLSGFLGETKTIEMMNEKAKAILMKYTEFTDPHGFDPKNVSTAQDLFQLARYITEVRPLFWEITKGKEVSSFGKIRFDIKELQNKNIFINDPNFVGGKTGYTAPAGNTALFVFKFLTNDKKTRNIVIVLLGSEDNKTDTQKIYKWLQENYSLSPASSVVKD